MGIKTTKLKRLFTSEVNSANLYKKKYKTKHDWVGKVIQWELCKKLKFEHTAK